MPGDGIDNDCDGRVDEEIKDGKDDDGDKYVDEDLALVNKCSGWGCRSGRFSFCSSNTSNYPSHQIGSGQPLLHALS